MDKHFSKRRFFSDLYRSLCEDMSLNSHDIDKLCNCILARGTQSVIADLYKLGSYWFEVLETGVPLEKSLLTFGRTFFPELFCFKDYQEIFVIIDTDSVSSTKVRFIRQLCFFASKAQDKSLPLPASETLFPDYVDKDESLPTEFENDPLLEEARRIISSIFSEFDPNDLVGRYGPGSVNNCPFSERYISKVPSNHVGYSTFCNTDHFLLDNHRLRPNNHFDYFRRGSKIQSEFLVVPKDLRGPRTICRETSWNQHHQQSLRRYMERAISHSPIVDGAVQFTDQSINGNYALIGSASRKYSTIDLKDASDRITYALVESLFQGTLLFEYMLLSRSQIVFCGDSKHRMKKWAPMGSAICFTTLSIVIYSLLRAASNLLGRNDEISVFGDDIIVETSFFDSAVMVLEKYGLLVNTGKSYSLSLFRESCGVDAYKGDNVTPVRLRHIPDGSVDTRIASFSATSHLLYNLRYFRTASVLTDWLVRLRYRGGRVLPGTIDSPYLSFPFQYYTGTIKGWVDKDHQVLRYKQKGLILSDRKISNPESESSFYYRVVYPSLVRHTVPDDDAYELSHERLSIRDIVLRSSVVEVRKDHV